MSSSSETESKDDDKDEEEEYDDYPPIIIDNGGGNIKCGFGSLDNDEPTSVLPSIVGHSKHTEIEYSDIYFGEQAMLKSKDKLSLSRPIKHGLIHNWDDMQLLWKYVFDKELKCLDDDIEYSTIVLSETPLNPRNKREKAIQIMFETFNCSSYYTHSTAVFELYSHGQTTGMVIGCGFDTCYTVPVYQGFALAHATNKMDAGGHGVDDYLCRLLHSKGFNLDQLQNSFDVIEEIKKSYCYVSMDYWQEMKNRDTLIWKNQNVIKYKLPDGKDITLGSNRFESGEIFFKPSLIGGHLSKNKSIAQYVYDSILSVNIDVRKDIASNICIAGAGSLLNGFTERIQKDVKSIVPMSLSVNISAKPNRNNAVFIGASILSCLSFFKENCISTEEYEEIGPKIVCRKCF